MKAKTNLNVPQATKWIAIWSTAMICLTVTAFAQKQTVGASSLTKAPPAQLAGSQWIVRRSYGASEVLDFMTDGRLRSAEIDSFYFRDTGTLDWDMNEHKAAFEVNGSWKQDGANIYDSSEEFMGKLRLG
jgi:hypothetical protein